MAERVYTQFNSDKTFAKNFFIFIFYHYGFTKFRVHDLKDVTHKDLVCPGIIPFGSA
jgi:hypothetical protein